MSEPEVGPTLAESLRQFRPLADMLLRGAVERYRSAKRDHDAHGRESGKIADEFTLPLDPAQRFSDVAWENLLDAEHGVIRAIVARSRDEYLHDVLDDVWRAFFPAQGAILDGSAFLVVPADPDDTEGYAPGQMDEGPTTALVRLLVMDRDRLDDLDDPADDDPADDDPKEPAKSEKSRGFPLVSRLR